MGTIKIYDRADDVRIEIAGRLHSDAISDVERAWRDAMAPPMPRRCTIDISRLTGYDAAGRRLLASMYQHGVQVAAATPLSLVFLNEISTPPPRRGPAVVRERPNPVAEKHRPYLRTAAGE